jgi:flagellar secretion chaperone FliS
MFVPGATRYKQVNVQTMSRGQILLALYETAIRYANKGAASIRQGNVVAKGVELQRVASIVAELASTLDRSAAPELCDNLEMLYFYMQERLAMANAKMDPEAAEEVARLLTTLKAAWEQAVAEVEGGAVSPMKAAVAR